HLSGVLVRTSAFRRELSLRGDHADGEYTSADERDTVVQCPASMLLVKANDDTGEDEQIRGIIDKSFEPGAEGGFAELYPGDHAVHFVEEAGCEEEQGAGNGAEI